MADAGSERRAELDRRMKERQAAIVTTAPSASTVETAAFTTRFRTAREGLQRQRPLLQLSELMTMAEIQELIEKAPSCTGVALTEILDTASSRIATLQKFLTDSTFFLPSHDVRTSQEVVNKFEATVTELRETLMPKKKFAFKVNA